MGNNIRQQDGQELAQRGNQVSRVYRMTAAALLIAIGILIPMVSPVKIVIDPMSFTLASHVAIFLGVLIAPDIAAYVVIGTTIGFFAAAFPLPVAPRAASHIVFALVASFYLKRRPQTAFSPVGFHVFSFLIGAIHAACEVVVVYFYYRYFGGWGEFVANDGIRTLFLLVGVGSLVHSMIDFEIAYGIFRVLRKQKTVRGLFITAPPRKNAAA
ncbi:MAG: hypothetical protein LBG82_04880 [Clostridiales Family XIII bacterium]|jgi:niacin transporter|nr:hypothetical protein [Clostridiales Family XIII bacterium]